MSQNYPVRPIESLGTGYGIVHVNAGVAAQPTSNSASASSDDDEETDAVTTDQDRGSPAAELLLRAKERIETSVQRGSVSNLDVDMDTVTEVNAGARRRRRDDSNAIYSYTQFSVSDRPIGLLPPEILCLIFSNMSSRYDLVNIALVCKYWAELIVELIWFRPGVCKESVYKKLGRVMEMPRSATYWDYRQYIRRLNMSSVPSLVTDDYLSLFRGCGSLERITLVNCSRIGSAAVAALLKGCSRLQSIDVTGIQDIQDDIYMELAANCKRLQGLYAPGSVNVSKGAVLEVINNCPLLKRVKLSDCPGVDDSVLHRLVVCCPNLVEIDLHGCSQITNGALHEMFSTLEYLKEFKISKNENVTGHCFDTVDGTDLSLDRLRIVDFTQCPNITDSAVQKVVHMAPRLRNVVLSKCTAITDTSLKAISALGRNLHYVHLGHCSNITDAGAKELIKSCYRLQYIDLACCTQLTNATVVELAQLPKLKRIGLVKCSQITDEGILALAENSRTHEDNLERVHLSYCMNLTIYPIYRLLKAFPKLTHISLTGVAQFLRNDITQFCREPPSEFNPHQKSIFCVFSGDGVNKLRAHLRNLLERPRDPQREINELLDIMATVTEGVNRLDDDIMNPDPMQRHRLTVFVDTLDRFINDFHQMDIPRAKLELFAKCVFTRLPTSQVPRIQRFFQILQNHPLQVQGRREQQQQQQQQEEQARRQTTQQRQPQARTQEQQGATTGAQIRMQARARRADSGSPTPQSHVFQQNRGFLAPAGTIATDSQLPVVQLYDRHRTRQRQRMQHYETRFVGGVRREFAIPRVPAEAELFTSPSRQQNQFDDLDGGRMGARRQGTADDDDAEMEDL